MKELLWQAYLAGFQRSGEGWNGEYPWYHGQEKQEEMKEELRDGVHGYEEWFETQVVEFDCSDCGEHVIRLRNDNVDIHGITPQRCGSCTLDRMAE